MTTFDIAQTRAERSWRLPSGLIPILFLLPCLVFLAVFFLVPAVTLFASSFMTRGVQGDVGLPLTLSNYARFFSTPLYAHVLMTTLRISLITSCIAVLLAYPVASVMIKSSPRVTRLVTLIILAPLVVSVVVRSYGWQLILSNGPNGILNWLLLSLGVIKEPLALLYAEPAVIIGSLHVYFPMMVLPLSSALAKINPAVEEAARTLGGNPWLVFRRIIVPLSLPGLAAGFTIVFSLTAGSFVIPVLLGGNSAQTLGVLIEQQILAVNDWPFGAAISVVLVLVVMAINLFSLRVLEKRNEG